MARTPDEPETRTTEPGPPLEQLASEPAVLASVTLAESAAEFGAAASAEDVELPKVRKRKLVSLFFAQAAIYMALVVPTAFSLAVKFSVIDSAGKDTALALAVGIGATVVIFTNPVISVLSDRTRSRLGRRRPWYIAGILIALAGGIAIGFGTTVPVVIAGWTVSIIGYTMSSGMIMIHLSDVLPASQRGKVMGINGAITQIGPIIGIIIAGALSSDVVLMLLGPAIVAFLGAIWFAFAMDDKKFVGEVPAFQIRELAKGFYFNPRRHPNYAWVLLSKFFVFGSLALGGIYGVYLLQSRLGLSFAEVGAITGTLGLGSVVLAIVGAVGSGWLSDKLGTRKPILIVAGILIAASPFIVGTLHSIPQYAIGGLLGAFAIGVYGAVDQALVLDVLPREGNQNGRYLSLFGLANAIPQAIGPFAAAAVLFIAGGDYTWVYFAAGAVALLGVVALIPISVGRRATMSTTSMQSMS